MCCLCHQGCWRWAAEEAEAIFTTAISGVDVVAFQPCMQPRITAEWRSRLPSRSRIRPVHFRDFTHGGERTRINYTHTFVHRVPCPPEGPITPTLRLRWVTGFCCLIFAQHRLKPSQLFLPSRGTFTNLEFLYSFRMPASFWSACHLALRGLPSCN